MVDLGGALLGPLILKDQPHIDTSFIRCVEFVGYISLCHKVIASQSFPQGGILLCTHAAMRMMEQQLLSKARRWFHAVSQS